MQYEIRLVFDGPGALQEFVNALQNGPHRVVAPVMAIIQRQINEQEEKARGDAAKTEASAAVAKAAKEPQRGNRKREA